MLFRSISNGFLALFLKDILKKKVDSTNSKKLSKQDWLVIKLNGNKTCNITHGKHIFLIFTECTLGSTHYRDANMNNHAQNNVRIFLFF